MVKNVILYYKHQLDISYSYYMNITPINHLFNN
jgi:hypothetical protein